MTASGGGGRHTVRSVRLARWPVWLAVSTIAAVIAAWTAALLWTAEYRLDLLPAAGIGLAIGVFIPLVTRR